ncbi:DUF1444 domain-containing protein [Exiguobacterium flavidum]|uniref:DUF1444 domain-containing protein n=1 Tax=Exiguobacterium flavidum TaxID=2184695 RepID=UPI000DF75457|nr:DUF1444 domain-containing protein [Exiguobacterium flavidum]
MEMNQIRRMITAAFEGEQYATHFDREKSVLRIERKSDRSGVDLGLNPLVAKAKRRGEVAVEETIEYVKAVLEQMNPVSLAGNEQRIFPVIRAKSFADETKEGVRLISTPHTGETKIMYAVDLGKTYRLIDEKMLKEASWNEEHLSEAARFNLKKLDAPFKQDEVAGNLFYFLSTGDGYEASRVLDKALLSSYAERIEGEFAVGIPHQDVLIFADIRNDAGYDVMQQLMFDFFTNGRVPVTALPFLHEDGELEPVFVLAKNKRPNA